MDDGFDIVFPDEPRYHPLITRFAYASGATSGTALADLVNLTWEAARWRRFQQN
jgi:hypothetical protein